MAVGMGILRAGHRSAREIASHSRAALDRPLAQPGELWTAIARDDGVLLGAFQRDASVPVTAAAAARWRRGSGGPAVRLGPDTVHVALALTHPGALTACDEKRIVNRSVRPLLRALTRVGATAHFFGRDWVSVLHRPAAWVGFAHDATTRRTLFEAFVAVRAPFHLAERPSFLGKSPGTLEAIVGKAIEPQRIVDAVVEAYVAAWAVAPVETATPEPLPPDRPQADDRASPASPSPERASAGPHRDRPQADDRPHEGPESAEDPPWAATVEEAIGTLGAGPDALGVFRIGGDLLVSRDALARLEARSPQVPDDALGALVDELLAAPGVALDGVRSLMSVRDVIALGRAGKG
jgi:hypothetical protein